MKKFVLTIALLLLGFAVQAQMKIHDDGHVSLGTLSGAWNVGAQFFPRSYHFNSLNTDPWNWVTIASPSRPQENAGLFPIQGTSMTIVFS